MQALKTFQVVPARAIALAFALLAALLLAGAGGYAIRGSSLTPAVAPAVGAAVHPNFGLDAQERADRLRQSWYGPDALPGPNAEERADRLDAQTWYGPDAPDRAEKR